MSVIVVIVIVVESSIVVHIVVVIRQVEDIGRNGSVRLLKETNVRNHEGAGIKVGTLVVIGGRL